MLVRLRKMSSCKLLKRFPFSDTASTLLPRLPEIIYDPILMLKYLPKVVLSIRCKEQQEKSSIFQVCQRRELVRLQTAKAHIVGKV